MIYTYTISQYNIFEFAICYFTMDTVKENLRYVRPHLTKATPVWDFCPTH